MLILFIFLMSSAFSMEMSSEKYCFGTARTATQVNGKLSMILLSQDKVTQDKDCLVVLMPEHRRELIQKYVLSIAPDAKITFSSAEIKKDPCHLKVEKKRVGNLNESSINATSGEVMISQSDQENAKSEVYFIQTLKEFELQVDLESITGTCRYITPERYEVTLRLKKSMKPLASGPTANATVILNAPSLPMETFELLTTLQIQRGEKINIGEVIKENRKKNREMNLSPNLRIENENGQIKETVLLSIQ